MDDPNLDDALLPAPTALVAATPETTTAVVYAAAGVALAIPPVIADAGEGAARMTLEFFTARIPDPHTRKA